MVENLFSTKIKSLRFDGGGEYSSTHLKFFFWLKVAFYIRFPTHTPLHKTMSPKENIDM